MKKSLLITSIFLIIGFGIFLIYSCIPNLMQPPEEKTQEMELSDYPEAFETDTLIVVGKEASQIEKESAELIKENLKKSARAAPVIIEDQEIQKGDKNSNLILVGTPSSNDLLQEVYAITDIEKVTSEYPGKNKGLLQILESPWNSNKALLIVVGSNELGMKAGSELLEEIQDIKKNSVIVEWKDSKSTFARTIPTDNYVFIEIKKRIKLKSSSPDLSIGRYPLTYYFDEKSGDLKIRALGGFKVRDQLAINDRLLVLIGNTIVIEKLTGSGKGIMPPIDSLPFSSQRQDLDFLEITYVQSNGIVYLRHEGKRIVLNPKKEYETSFEEERDEGVHTVIIKNHGLQDKKRIIAE